MRVQPSGIGGVHEPYRVGRRAYSERGWSPWDDGANIRQSYVNERCASCWSTRTNIRRSGRRCDRWPRNWACRTELLRRWVRHTERDGGLRPGLPTDERERLKQLERENFELRRANEILKKASAYFAQAELDRRAK